MTSNPDNSAGRLTTEGWRVFMRGAERDLSESLIKAPQYSENGSCSLQLARAFVLAKHGRTTEARREIEAVQQIIGNSPDASGRARADLILVDAHVRVYEDRPSSESDGKNLKWALDVLEPDDQVGQGLALNQLCIFSLHMGNFDRAQEYGESAIRLYRQGGAEFGSLHLHAHLGQIKMMRGDLEGAAAQYADMEARLGRLPDDSAPLLAVSHALRSEVAYEMNDLYQSHALLSDAMVSVEEDDAWLDVRAAAYRVRTRLAYARFGLPGALTELSHCEHVAERRGMPRLLRLMQVERLRALTLSDEIEAARSIMRSIGLTPERYEWGEDDDWALRQGTTAVAVARWMVRARHAKEALAFIEPAEDFAIRGGQLLSLAKLRVIRSAAHWRLNQKGDATATLLSALRLLGKQPFHRFILDEGQEALRIIQAALDGHHVSARPNMEQRRRLAEISHFAMIERGGQPGGTTGEPGNSSGKPDYTKKYLELMALGLSNKEIGRTMGVSVNTVKYHLKAIFNELRVANRTHAVSEAKRLGLLQERR